MPNQDPNQNPQSNLTVPDPEPVNEPITPVVASDTEQPVFSSSIPAHNDLPPLPDFMTQSDTNMMQNNANMTQDDVNNSVPPTSQTDSPVNESLGSAAPSDLPPMVASPKKKFGGKRIIATILGIFLLVGGVGTGVYLVNQQQNANSKAATYYVDGKPVADREAYDSAMRQKASNDETNSSDYTKKQDAAAQQKTQTASNECGGFGQKACQVTKSTTTDNCTFVENGAITCTTKEGVKYDPNNPGSEINSGFPAISDATAGCGSGNYHQGPNGNYYCGQSSSSSDKSGAIVPTPVPTFCQDVKAYDSAWTLLTSSNLSMLKSGDSVNFCVAGTTNTGAFDKAKFTINTVEQTETTSKRPDSNDYCQSYTIPTGVTTFNVTAQIHHSTSGWK